MARAGKKSNNWRYKDYAGNISIQFCAVYLPPKNKHFYQLPINIHAIIPEKLNQSSTIKDDFNQQPEYSKTSKNKKLHWNLLQFDHKLIYFAFVLYFVSTNFKLYQINLRVWFIILSSLLSCPQAGQFLTFQFSSFFIITFWCFKLFLWNI